MLVIRLQRTGRKGQARFRLVVQESHRAPTSGRVIANLGYYDPHSKDNKIDLKQAETYLNNGAQPSSRAIRLLESNKLKLPSWVKKKPQKKAPIKNPDKLRRNRPPEPEPAPEKRPNEEKTDQAPKTTAKDDQEATKPTAAEKGPDPEPEKTSPGPNNPVETTETDQKQ